MSQIPDRGDLVWISFSPQSGHEQKGRRPAVVVSEKDFNEFTGFAVVCPIIGEQKDFVFEVPLPDGFEVHGVILTDQFKSLDYTTRNVDIVGHADVNSDFMKLVMRNVQAILA